jgi:hypothetical protein
MPPMSMKTVKARLTILHIGRCELPWRCGRSASGGVDSVADQEQGRLHVLAQARGATDGSMRRLAAICDVTNAPADFVFRLLAAEDTARRLAARG